MTEATARFALPLLQAGQAQKELFHNEALTAIDGLLSPAVEAISTESPPSAPAAGDSFIVGASGSGVWEGQVGHLATWTSGGWRFTKPVPGLRVWLKDTSRWAWHDGMAWRDDLPASMGLRIDGVRVVGAQQSAVVSPSGGSLIDTEARAAVTGILQALREHGLIAT